MSSIYILTGPVKSGKSSRLLDWVQHQPGVSGILSLLIGGKKYLYSISDKQKKCLETSNKNAVIVGRYLFDPKAFYWAQKQLVNELSLADNYLLIDEIGYLELKGEGLEPTLSKIINTAKERNDIMLILVVRDSLVDQVITKYDIDNSKIIREITELI